MNIGALSPASPLSFLPFCLLKLLHLTLLSYVCLKFSISSSISWHRQQKLFQPLPASWVVSCSMLPGIPCWPRKSMAGQGPKLHLPSTGKGPFMVSRNTLVCPAQ